jgi:hypothetical protein
MVFYFSAECTERQDMIPPVVWTDGGSCRGLRFGMERNLGTRCKAENILVIEAHPEKKIEKKIDIELSADLGRDVHSWGLIWS